MEETAVANNIWRTVCQVILFDDITNVRFFPINDDENSNENIDYLKVLIEDAIMEAEGRDKSHQQILNHVRDSQSLVTKTPWLRHTRWEEIFVGKDMSMLGQLTNAPSIDDHRERQVWDATARVIQHCFHGVVNCQERGWTLIPFWLRSVDRNKEDTKPFRTYIAPYTLRRYISYWQQFIIFSLRAIFFRRFIGNILACPYLAMRMRIARAHHFAAVFKNLNVMDVCCCCKLHELGGPRPNHPFDLR